jgi:hypothetical protein
VKQFSINLRLKIFQCCASELELPRTQHDIMYEERLVQSNCAQTDSRANRAINSLTRLLREVRRMKSNDATATYISMTSFVLFVWREKPRMRCFNKSKQLSSSFFRTAVTSYLTKRQVQMEMKDNDWRKYFRCYLLALHVISCRKCVRCSCVH